MLLITLSNLSVLHIWLKFWFYLTSQYDKNARREMVSVESSSKGCSETLFSTHLTQKRPKPKKKVLKVTIKIAVP